ncbi:uncharacterized protein B0H18DRAFT_983168, partial [Fomitopsis serialis]|uniref:uncharacterized protein n=1 Tax=Fomitopsis serialis TaxID=139415 RepID=UPI002007FDC6
MNGTHADPEALQDGQGHATMPLLRVEMHEHSGRSYHVTRAIPAGTTVLEAETPYAYTIWKPFRNEVCAECWRYDGGRRSFLTRRDDEGTSGDLDEEPREGARAGNRKTHRGYWLRREGRETVRLLCVLEGARRQKEVEKDKDGGFRLEDLGTDLTRENVDRAWDMVAQKERLPKEVRRWRNLQLDHFETDMARYVLIALVRRYREVYDQEGRQSQQQLHTDKDAANNTYVRRIASAAVHFGGASWDDFTALQVNELQHLNTYPEVLENQIRVYQALKGRFPTSHVRASTSEGRTVVTDTGGNGESHNCQASQIGQGDSGGFRDFGSLITVDNVRRAFSVDPGNSFGIWETPLMDESELMGFAVYPKPSFFNHNCLPNVAKVRRGRALEFVTTRAIEAGEELCISYGHVEGMALEERQRELREGWFFECRCGRCVAEAETHNRRQTS